MGWSRLSYSGMWFQLPRHEPFPLPCLVPFPPDTESQLPQISEDCPIPSVFLSAYTYVFQFPLVGTWMYGWWCTISYHEEKSSIPENDEMKEPYTPSCLPGWTFPWDNLFKSPYFVVNEQTQTNILCYQLSAKIKGLLAKYLGKCLILNCLVPDLDLVITRNHSTSGMLISEFKCLKTDFLKLASLFRRFFVTFTFLDSCVCISREADDKTRLNMQKVFREERGRHDMF